MSSLHDHIDRFSTASKFIQTSTRRFTSTPLGPFARAILETPLSELIRELDVAELGLFSLVPPAPPHVDAPVRETVTRTEIVAPTPLRKNMKKEMRPDPEPEVYAEAALRFLDRYQDLRAMPEARAKVQSITKNLRAIRKNMTDLHNALEQPSIDPCTSKKPIKVQADDVDRKIKEMQSRIQLLKKRKEALLNDGAVFGGNPKSTPASFPKSKPLLTSPPPATAAEEEFWMTPGPSTRNTALSFRGDKENLLMDEEIGDVSMGDIASPVPPPRMKAGSSASSRPASSMSHLRDDPGPEVSELEDDDDDDDIAEKTVVLKMPPDVVSDEPPAPSTPSTAPSEIADSNLTGVMATPSNPSSSRTAATPASSAKKRLRVNNEMERIVAKVWSTVGDIIMPGHPFDATGKTANRKPPRAKETSALLGDLSNSHPTPSSPSQSSITFTATEANTSSDNAETRTITQQQILTAHLLLTLLTSSPHYSMPLNKLKVALAEKGGTGSSGTRVLYACVAKKLIKIDRGGGEQVVKFDV